MRALVAFTTLALLSIALVAAPASTAAAGPAAVSFEATGTAGSAPPTITVAAVGDLLFDSAPGRLIDAQGGKAPFTKVAPRLSAADVTVGNLECPISNRGSALAGKTFTFRGRTRAVEGLKYAGFDLLSMANNHVRDYGPTALADSMRRLKAAGLPFAGAGRNRDAAWEPVIIERGGATIAFLGFSEITPASFAATSSRSGTAFVSGNFAQVEKAIRAASKKADYVIVSFHWGIERQGSPTARQVSEGRRAIKAGADLVLSHHPHVVQGVEFYKKGLIAYSLGNFVFSPGSAAGRDSMILTMKLGPSGVRSVRARPVWIGYNGRPVPTAEGSRANTRILRLIRSRSRARGTHVKITATEAKLTP